MPIPHPLEWRPSRRAIVQLSLIVPFIPRPGQERKVQNLAGGEPQFVDPPREPDAEKTRRIEELAALLAAGKATANGILLDPSSNELRPYPAFREAIAKHAQVGRAALTPRGEPGVPMLATVRVLDGAKRPRSHVRVYAYQTCAKGWYAAEAPHVSGNAGDYGFARLFTYGRTDLSGRCELVTVHPAGYPRSDLPSHIHLLLESLEGEVRGTEIRFEDCPRMTPAERERSLRSGFVVAPVEKLDDGGLRCTAEFELQG